MSPVDITIVVILFASTVMGGFRGVVREAVSLAAWILALWLAYRYYGQAGELLGSYNLHEALSNPLIQNVAGFLMVLVIIFLAVGILGWLLRSLITITGLSPIDRLLGLVFGFARGLLVVVLLVSLADMTSMTETTMWKSATLIRPFKMAALVMSGYLPALLPDH